VKGLLRWAAFVALFYVTGLGVWRAIEPAYVLGLRGAFVAVRSIGMIPPTLEPVAVPGLGLAVLIPGRDGLAIPQRILGADLALTVALVLGTYWVPLKHRLLYLAAAAACVFVAHTATILSQYWISTASSASGRAAWSLWTTLYQGKVVPLAVWAVFLATSKLRADTPATGTA
jgi:hypothetical protein